MIIIWHYRINFSFDPKQQQFTDLFITRTYNKPLSRYLTRMGHVDTLLNDMVTWFDF